jgi:outer membrane protein TolC
MICWRVICLLGLAGTVLRAEPLAIYRGPLPPAPAIEEKGTVLTWTDCVRLATAHNPDIQAARESVLNSDAVRRGAYSLLFPQITASFNDTRAYVGPTLVAPQNYSTAYSAQLTISQVIFNGFLTKGNIDQARAQLNLAFADLDAQKASSSYQLKTAFAQLLYSQQLIVIFRNVIDILQNNARLVKLLYDGGTEDRGAMLLSQADLDQAIYQYNQALRTNGLSGVQLAEAIGQDVPGPIVGEGDLVTAPLSVTPNFEKLAVETPLYNQRRAQADAAAAGITIAQSGFYPTITAGATAAENENTFPPSNHSLSAGFAVTYPIFEGGRTYFDVKAAWASLRGALDSLRSGTDQSTLTLAQVFKNLVDTHDNVGIQQELLEATALRYKIADANYRNGLMSFEDFNTITNAYVSEQQALLTAKLNAVVAEANWEEARGLGAIP